MKILTLDPQGFMVNNEFIVKELAISNGTQIYHSIFKPKTDFSMLSMKDKRTVEYLENNHHGIKYNDGFVDYKELDDIIEKISIDIDIVYVSGHQKYDFLSRLLEGKHTKVVNVENQGLSQLKLNRDYPQCMAHKDNFQMCSLVNCKRIWKWNVDVNDVDYFAKEDSIDLKAKSYLENYGYLKKSNNSDQEITEYSVYSDGITKFQEFFNLKPTGHLNNETLNLMKQRRCGVTDFAQNFVIMDKWLKKKLVWKFVRGNMDDELMTTSEFNVWQKNSDLSFHKNETHNDILIKYSSINHTFHKSCGGPGKCTFNFDGPGIVLAHAYFPQDDTCREIHLDSSEK
ncbi:hypothetical protein WA026_021337 [Henosepilachna vigintioctopunctata]|uniref:Uncharacterized protein n=1 Tax=Henosepilachna vigintioctopunctata TaxID=420089 RepID=A0AAW1U3Q1_9CUCU